MFSARRLASTNQRRAKERHGNYMIPLALANVGEEMTIKKIGGTPEVKKHLENLGFVVGGNAKVITSLDGNVIVNVKEARIAISEEMALKIMV